MRKYTLATRLRTITLKNKQEEESESDVRDPANRAVTKDQFYTGLKLH